ncbi:phage Gp37/Gp68 family protein [Stenotrophomonas sp.]|uniref:DUF5131 family protein n=1 Tax=Stenotrophomonas sp. TaxID=69392 RepID=UPI0028B12B78|nr:phage Gp37/Gp68 family protein [Stenotrophomonas sp.]
MSTSSRIEWTERTWNPAVGCTKVSAGCKHCYAVTLAKRLQAMGLDAYKHGFRLKTLPERLDEPRQRKKPTMYFVNSMSDLFHERITDGFLDSVMEVISDTPQHRYQILTKRHERLGTYFAGRDVPSNVWLGVSVENKRHGVPRIDVLRKIPAKIRFLSCEPLLEDLGSLDLTGIHWVIVGGESGPGARPMQPDWARAIRTQCEAQDATFFFKQWGGWGADGKRRSKKANGRELDGRQWNGMPGPVSL